MKKNLLSLITAAALLFSMQASASNPTGNYGGGNSPLQEYQPGVIYVKMKPHTRVACLQNYIGVNSLNEKFATLGVTKLKKNFPNAAVPSMERNITGEPLVDITLIYKLTYTSKIKMETALSMLRSDANVEYAEPSYLARTNYTPNDPNRTNQYFLTNIKAYTGWDVWKGDTNTVIGIIDSGTDPDHPDLAANLKHNYADPINGIDDDLDGFIDNFSGWDISDNDNDATVGCQDHGSHVSGCAAEVTDNGVGGCGAGFKCRFLPVKCTQNTDCSYITDGYEGIVYAADHGCNVINMSWGGGGYSQYAQDIINYAFINKNATIIASAGNTGTEVSQFPSSFENVISVAATTNTDAKSGFSTWGYDVDVCSPGSGIYSTVFNNTYASWDGTSMASPIAAGVAAMIKSKFPSYNSAQVAQKLRTTADNIYGVSGNATYANKLGKGRVNMYAALTDTTSPGVAMKVVNIYDKNDNVFLGNDTVRMQIKFTNLLHKTTSAAVATISVASTQVTLIGSATFPLGVMNTFDTLSNFSIPFTYKVKTTAPINGKIPFKVTITDGAYTDFIAYYVVVNVDYININVNDVATTATSKSRIGYTDISITTGLGFQYLGSPSNLYELGLMIGNGTNEVADGIRNGATQNEDFGYTERITAQTPTVSDFYANGNMNENGPTATNKLGITVRHNAYAWTTAPDRKYVILEYWIKNINASGTLSNMYAGIYGDWDVINLANTSDYSHNRDSVDVTRKMGIVYNIAPDGYYCATKVLTNTAGFKHYAANNDGSNGSIDLYTGYTDAQKYTTLSTNRPLAGEDTIPGRDVSDITSTGPFSILHGDSIKVAFAILACENLSCLLAAADAAQIKYDGLFTAINEAPAAVNNHLSVYPNPANKTSAFSFTLAQNSDVNLSVYNSLGAKVKELVNEKLSAGNYTFNKDLSSLQSGTYFVKLISSDKSELEQLIIVR